MVLNYHTYPIRKGMLFFFQPYQLHHVYAEVHPDTPYERKIFYVEPIVMNRYLEAFPHCRAFFSRLWKGRNQQQVFNLSSYMNQLDWVYESYHQSRSRVGRDESYGGRYPLIQVLCFPYLSARNRKQYNGLRHSPKAQASLFSAGNDDSVH
ncbi:MAG TPA: hypothetical protein DEF35_04060 [Paenibacillus sp.]|nr:hypothetical protein CA599_11960 [Paenibacillus taichungensis]HBU80801.1 hypothetical protein [Paenibacillus sp.]